MGKFINPFTDEGFKRIFGQEMSKPVLLTFLNSLLKDERRIVNVQYLDKDQAERHLEGFPYGCGSDGHEAPHGILRQGASHLSSAALLYEGA